MSVKCKIAAYIPSRLEGFGLTAVESMALGTPVIASNNSALPETLGGAGILVDPTDATALADAAENIYKDQNQRAKLVQLGLRRAEEFTWTKCIKRLLAGIKSQIQCTVASEAVSKSKTPLPAGVSEPLITKCAKHR